MTEFSVPQNRIEVSSDAPEVNLTINYVTGSNAIFIWTDNANNPMVYSSPEDDFGDYLGTPHYQYEKDGSVVIKLFEDEKYRVLVNKNATILTIKHPQLKDSGEYTLSILNLVQYIGYKSQQKIQLIVKGLSLN